MRNRTLSMSLILVAGLGLSGCQRERPATSAGPAPTAAPAPIPSPAPSGDAPKTPEQEPFGRFTIAELEAKLAAARDGKLQLFIYDNNSEERYRKSHIPTARWIDYTTIGAGDLPKDKAATLVFYCANEH